MSKFYYIDIESELREGNYTKIAALLHQFGKYKGCPIQRIEKILIDFVKLNRELGHDETQIALMIDGEWLKLESFKRGGASLKKSSPSPYQGEGD